MKRPPSSLFLAAWIAVVGLAVVTAAAADWPQWRGPQETGVSPENDWTFQWPAEGPKVLWKAEVGAGYSAFSVADGKAYTMGFADGKDTVWCFDAETGAVVWQFAYASEAGDYPGPRCTPTVAEKRVYTMGRLGQLYCLDAEKGTVVWSKNLIQEFKAPNPTWQLSCSPVVLGDLVIVDAGVVVAFDKATGTVRWQTDVEKPGYATPMPFTAGQTAMLALFQESGLVIRNVADGKEVGRAKWTTSYGVNAVTPIVVGNQIFVSSGYNVGGGVFELDGTTLKPVWKSRTMKNHANSCILWEGNLYGFNGQVNEAPLTCIDFKTGERRWAENSVRAGSLMIADGKIVAITTGGDLVIAEAKPDAYHELARAKILGPTCWTMPVLANGRVYCRNEKGQAVCVDVKQP